MPVQHRITRSEADQAKPLAYLSMYRPSRRRRGGYLAAALAGGLLALIAAAALAMIAGAAVGL